MGKLDGKAVVVTGASRGIGAEIAKVFAAEGGKVICAARTLKEGEHPLEGSLETTVKGIKDAGGEATPVAVNISEESECEKLIQAARDAYGPVDRRRSTGAMGCCGQRQAAPTSRWLLAWAGNDHAAVSVSELVLEEMVERGGSIVTISSGAAIGPGRGPYHQAQRGGGTCYGAEKAALERFTQGLAAEVYADNVSVTCVSPSQVVPTPGTVFHKLVKSLDDPRGESPELMAKAALLLATEPLDKVSGRVTYSQQILKEFGWIDEAKGTGVGDAARAGSGYSQI